MFVPAIAFAWWLVALPIKSLPAIALDSASHAAAAPLPAPHAGAKSSVPAHADADADDDTPSAERIPLRGAIPSNVIHAAQTFLDLPLGAERVVRIDDTNYLFVLEWHFHPRGFVGAPTGWHKGVTVYLTK